MGLDLLTVEVSRTLTHKYQIGFLRTSDRPVAKTPTWQKQHSQQTDIHSTDGIRARHYSKQAPADPRLEVGTHL
jgi:hypothetical protein